MTKTPDGIEVIEKAKPGRRRRFTAEEKRQLVAEATAPGSSISLVARRHEISSSLLFRWRRLMEQGGLESLGADELVVPASEAKQLRSRVRELERLLGKKTLEAGRSFWRLINYRINSEIVARYSFAPRPNPLANRRRPQTSTRHST